MTDRSTIRNAVERRKARNLKPLEGGVSRHRHVGSDDLTNPEHWAEVEAWELSDFSVEVWRWSQSID